MLVSWVVIQKQLAYVASGKNQTIKVKIKMLKFFNSVEKISHCILFHHDNLSFL